MVVFTKTNMFISWFKLCMLLNYIMLWCAIKSQQYLHVWQTNKQTNKLCIFPISATGGQAGGYKRSHESLKLCYPKLGQTLNWVTLFYLQHIWKLRHSAWCHSVSICLSVDCCLQTCTDWLSQWLLTGSWGSSMQVQTFQNISKTAVDT